MRSQCLGLLLLSVCCVSGGCSVVMASRAPQKKDLSVLTPGTNRSHVIAELGVPTESRQSHSGQVDLFSFNQGYSMGTRVSRCMVHGLLDLNTLCLWELIGTPLETSLSGEPVRAEVAYSPDGRVQSIEYFAGAHLANGGPTLATWMRRDATVQTAVVGNKPQAAGYHPNEILPASAGASSTGSVQAADYSTDINCPLPQTR
jgi:hypothetical protein